MLAANTDITTINKSYYEGMLPWYFRKYLKNYTHVRYLFVIAIFFVVAAFLIYQTSSTVQEVKRYPFPIYFEDEVNYFAKIKSIESVDETINFSLARYVLTKYILRSEEFDSNSIDPKPLEARLNFIKSISSSKVFQEYFKFIDIEKNLDSPLLKYRYGNSRSVIIDKIEFATDVNVPYSAKVYYTVNEILNNVKNTIQKNAEIKFFMSAVNKDFVKSGKQFTFLITDFTPGSDNE